MILTETDIANLEHWHTSTHADCVETIRAAWAEVARLTALYDDLDRRHTTYRDDAQNLMRVDEQLRRENARLARVEQAARDLLSASDTLAVDLVLMGCLSDEAEGRWHVSRADLRAALAEAAGASGPSSPNPVKESK